jgi:hypothetical protein
MREKPTIMRKIPTIRNAKKKKSNPNHFLGKHRKHSILGKVEPIIFPYAPWEINKTDWLLCIPFGSAFVY